MSNPNSRLPSSPDGGTRSIIEIDDINLLPEDEEEEEPYFDYFYDAPGSTPGTLSIEEDAPLPEIVLIDYDSSGARQIQVDAPEVCAAYLDTSSVSWVDVQGLGSENVLRRLGSVFHLHPLVLEDVVNVPQRPKVERYDEHLLIITRMVTEREKGKGFHSEQVSFILGQHYLLTVQEQPERDSFDPVRDRINRNKGFIRRQQVDYLAYALIDAVIDGFFPVLEAYGEYIEELEEEIVTNPTRQTLEQIHDLRRELFALRRSIWPQRTAINTLIRDSGDFISPEVQIYLRDCYDHVIQVLDIVETYRELVSSLMDVYLSSVSNRMNEVMKLLTVISTIFIPLTFVAGVYGMNFDPTVSPYNMPELEWAWGYLACWGLMIAIAIGLIIYFWRRGWFENFSTVKR
jgi:magnesium transporter